MHKKISWREKLWFYSFLVYLNVDKKYESITSSIQFDYSKNNQKLLQWNEIPIDVKLVKIKMIPILLKLIRSKN